VQLRYPAKEEQLFLAKAPLGRVIASIGDRIENVKKVKFSSAGLLAIQYSLEEHLFKLFYKCEPILRVSKTLNAEVINAAQSICDFN